MTILKPIAGAGRKTARMQWGGARQLLVVAVLAGLANTMRAHPGHVAGPASFAPDDVLLVAAASPQDAPRRSNRPDGERSGNRPSGDLKNEVRITVEGGYRVIRANGIPDHAPGQFPNRGNPNRIAAQRYEFRVPAEPKIAARTTPLQMQPFGVAVNGVVFDPGAAEWWRGDWNWQYEPMSGAINLGVDQNNAHVQPTGAYHYHAIPTGLLNLLTGGRPKLVLVGWAADGFPIYGPWGYSDPKDARSKLNKLRSSYRVKQGMRPDGPGGKYDGSFVADYEYAKGAGDLDECNGRTGVTPEFPGGTYHYVLTEEFPYIPRMYRGTPDPSFRTHGPGGGRGPGGPGGPPGFGPPRGGRPGGFERGRGFPPPQGGRQESGKDLGLASDSLSRPALVGAATPTADGNARLDYPPMDHRSWPSPQSPGWDRDSAFALAALPPPPPFPHAFPVRLEDWTAADWDWFFEPPPSFARHRGGPPPGWPPPPPPPHFFVFPPPRTW